MIFGTGVLVGIIIGLAAAIIIVLWGIWRVK